MYLSDRRKDVENDANFIWVDTILTKKETREKSNEHIGVFKLTQDCFVCRVTVWSQTFFQIDSSNDLKSLFRSYSRRRTWIVVSDKALKA